MITTITITVDESDADGDDEVDHVLPAVWEICSRCRGNGTHTNPAIDGNGITADEWNGPDWDDDSREGYLTGRYDVACEEGCSNGKVLVVAADQLSPAQQLVFAAWQEQESERHRFDYEDAYTRRMESGGY